MTRREQPQHLKECRFSGYPYDRWHCPPECPVTQKQEFCQSPQESFILSLHNIRLKPIVLYPPKVEHEMIRHEKAPFVFLAGPIQGAPDWHTEAIERLSDHSVNPVVACPKAPGEWHKNYYGQVDWETIHLARAAKLGVILFWLAKPDPESPQPEGRAYAQTSRFELGEWVTHKALKPMHRVNLVIGIEPGFSNERYLRHRIDGLFPGMVIHTRLWTACEEVVETVRSIEKGCW